MDLGNLSLNGGQEDILEIWMLTRLGGEIVQEVCRGVRLHISHFVKALDSTKEKMAQLGLGHSYSRSKVKFNVNRADNMVIQGTYCEINGVSISGDNILCEKFIPKPK